MGSCSPSVKELENGQTGSGEVTVSNGKWYRLPGREEAPRAGKAMDPKESRISLGFRVSHQEIAHTPLSHWSKGAHAPFPQLGLGLCLCPQEWKCTTCSLSGVRVGAPTSSALCGRTGCRDTLLVRTGYIAEEDKLNAGNKEHKEMETYCLLLGTKSH